MFRNAGPDNFFFAKTFPFFRRQFFFLLIKSIKGGRRTHKLFGWHNSWLTLDFSRRDSKGLGKMKSGDRRSDLTRFFLRALLFLF